MWKIFSRLGIGALAMLWMVPAGAQSLPALDIDPARISTSGLSSGGFMAVQTHVAFSASIMGAGVVAAGPFDCARAVPGLDQRMAAARVCSRALPAPPDREAPDLDKVIALMKHAGGQGSVDDLSHLCGAKVYLYSGTRDEMVPQAVSNVLRASYDTFAGPRCGAPAAGAIQYVADQPVIHAFVTAQGGQYHLPDAAHRRTETHEIVGCGELAALPAKDRRPFICNGGYDTAGAILQHVYGPLTPPVPAVLAHLKTFEQHPYAPQGMPAADFFHRFGHVYVPAGCAAGASCALHVVFHGCQQNQDMSGDAFYTATGYNGWAEANNIIVLYPQAQASWRANPGGCWDFWGYSGRNFDHRTGPQLATIRNMINAVGGKIVIPEKAATANRGGVNR